MLNLQKLMDGLSIELRNAELSKSNWPLTSDLLLDQLPSQLANLKAFGENLMAIQPLVNQVNESANRMTGSNLLLSHVILKRLEELNTRWKLLQLAIDERKKALEQAIIDHGSAQQQFLNAAVDHPWERAVASNKVPYYIEYVFKITIINPIN
jgi:dystrophin